MFDRILQILQRSFQEAPDGSVSTLFVAGIIISFPLESGGGAMAVFLFCSVFGLFAGLSFGFMPALAIVTGGMLALLIATQSLSVILWLIGGVLILIGITGFSDIFYKKKIGKE